MMPTYTINQLGNEGPSVALAMLMTCLTEEEPFVTYGSICRALEIKLEIPKIFPTHIGHVAGTMMDMILKADPKAPLINVLVTRANGIPGVGIGNYVAKKYKKPAYKNWEALPKQNKLEMVKKVRREVLAYKDWPKIYDTLFGIDPETQLPKTSGTEQDGKPPDGKRFGGAAESLEHKKLKEWVASNPKAVGLKAAFKKGYPEAKLLSGDQVDVQFANGERYVMVEVKSCRSNDEDFKRGIYQCVKYRAVKKAEHEPYAVKVDAVLVTERKLNTELAARAKLLKVKHVLLNVNKHCVNGRCPTDLSGKK